MKVSIVDTTVGRIKEVAFPSEFGLNNEGDLSAPGPEVRIRAVNIFGDDPEDQTQPGDANLILALITFEGLKQGVTLILVSDDTLFGIQDESSNIITVSTSSGQLTVP